MEYPFIVIETWQCVKCKTEFTAEVKYLDNGRACILSPINHIDSLLKHRDAHVKAGEFWESWNVTWGKEKQPCGYTGMLSGAFYIDDKPVSESEFRKAVNTCALKRLEEMKNK